MCPSKTLLEIISFGFIVFAASSVAIALSCMVFVMRWQDKDEIATLDSEFYRTYYVCTPDLSSLEKEIEKEYNVRRKELEREQALEDAASEHIHGENCSHGHDDHDELEGETWRSRKYLLDQVRKEKQIISPESQGSWNFDWNPSYVKGDYILLRFKFYSNNRREKVNGIWSIEGSDWTHDFSGYPFLDHEIKIPADAVSQSGSLKLIYAAKGSSYVIFPVYHGGINLLYDSGGIFKNYLLLLLFSVLHMATLTALSMTFSSLFSYSVAVFVTTTAYITGAFSQFFVNVLNDLAFHDKTILNRVFTKVIELGLWFSEGTQAFPAKDMFSEGISIPFISIMKTDFSSYLVYLLAVSIVGILALTRKEIDKILQH